MEREQGDDEVVCVQCGAPIAAEGERSYSFGVGNVLCYACAMARGGRYDAGRDTWTDAPDVSGLRDEAYGASPHEVRRRR